jgi:hypothetical protein
MTAQKDNLAEQTPATTETEDAKAEAIDRVTKDARQTPEQYVEQTESPGGGE